MRKGVFSAVAVIISAAIEAVAGGQAATSPFQGDARFTPAGRIDELVLAALQKKGIKSANMCSDEVFLRRAYFDVIGTLPEPKEARDFIADKNPDKRAAIIEALLKRGEFVDYWTLKWCDLLRVKAEFPINLWPNAVQAYNHWIRDAVKENRPYDRFVRELLTSSGSNFRVPPANFYRAVQGREPSAMAAAVALTFMGARFDKWPKDRQAGMAAFFSRVAFKSTGEWKEEIVYMSPEAAGELSAVFPDGKAVKIPPGKDPREVLADWLITAENPWFARNMANRIWSWLMGRGIIHEPDDMRPDNPPSNPELLAYLETELVKSKYDAKHIFRLVLNSSTYRQSATPNDANPAAESLFAHYIIRRLDAEVLIDALCRLGNSSEEYWTDAPEPYTYIPRFKRTISLADGSITSSLLEMFGRPARDTGLESERNNTSSDAQRLYMLNSSDIRDKIGRSPRIRQALDSAGANNREAIRGIYLGILSRFPTGEELALAEKGWTGTGSNKRQAAENLAWALVNSKEFLYRH